jgi:hypothetical protein
MTGRRSFVRKTLGGAVGAMLVGTATDAHAGQTLAEPWLDELAAKKHKAFLDVGIFATDVSAFRRTRALLTALKDGYGASERDIGIAFGAHGSGLGYVLSPAAWNALGLVDLIGNANLRATEAAALRNATRNWGEVCAENVAALRQMGVRFLACRNTIGRWADRIATQRKTAVASVTEEIIGGLHPGVEPVPAMIAAAVLAQERRVSYLAIT